MSVEAGAGAARAEEVLEVLASARSMRWFKDDPVEWSLVQRVIWAGTRASSPNNTQNWDFVVVTSPETKRRIQAAIISAGQQGTDDPEFEPPADVSEYRTFLGAQNVLARMDKIPVLIFVCGANTYPDPPILEWAYSAMHTAGQNMLVAARALGLGAAFTTFHQQAAPEIRDILGIPADRLIGVTMPLGWPTRGFGPVRRRPVEEVIHRETW